MTRATYRQVLLSTGLAFCAAPHLGVNRAAATHPIGLVPPGDDGGAGPNGAARPGAA